MYANVTTIKRFQMSSRENTPVRFGVGDRRRTQPDLGGRSGIPALSSGPTHSGGPEGYPGQTPQGGPLSRSQGHCGAGGKCVQGGLASVHRFVLSREENQHR